MATLQVLVEAGDRRVHGDGGADGALGVVLVCHRGAEDGHHRVADVLVDGAAEALDLASQDRKVRRQDAPQVLGVESLAERC